jgi:hypothetical protein
LFSEAGATFFVKGSGFLQRKKKEQKERKLRKGKPVETAAVEEIDQGGLRHHFLDDFHSCLKKPTPKTLRLLHSYHRPDGDELSKRNSG